MKLLNTSKLEIKKSKFLGYCYHLDQKEEVKTILEELKKEHKKASHFVYAYKFSTTAGKSDDKEPSGTAGLPLYNLLEHLKKKDTLIVVIRYFGGTKLGVGPLTRAYLEAGKNALN